MANIEEKVENLIKPKVEGVGYELYDVLYLKEGKNYILRIVIDNEKGISLEDCEKVNNEITDLLDEADYIKEQYFLEVSSPGIERVLRKDWQLKKYLENKVQINLFKKDENGFKEYVGILKQVEDESLKLEQDGTVYEVQRKNIAQVKTIYEEVNDESNR
ncbi:MAG: ribosome maturation factor RimP [Clostridia bacterium]|nr:ribosome maturation factor RimP [Clostridia bacterium]